MVFCRKEYMREWKKRNPDKCKKYCKKYYENNLYKFKKYRKKNKERIKKWWKKNKDKHKGYAFRYRERYPERIKATNKLNYAIKTGKVIRPTNCSKCGEGCIPHGHHEDYSKPLEVIWLCEKCHTKIHKTNKGSDIRANNRNQLAFRK